MTKLCDQSISETSMALGLVIPTLGRRRDMLIESVRSVRAAGSVFLVIVAPAEADLPSEVLADVDLIVEDPARGLAAAINAGIACLPEVVHYVSWLGDDDRLLPDTVTDLVYALHESDASMIYGQCEYIAENGAVLWTNKSGRFAAPLMRFGPQLIPQPGSIFRRSDYVGLGGLDETLQWAFDLDLFIRFAKLRNGFAFFKSPVAQFRWHADSLTAGSRKGSVIEASQVRKKYLPNSLAKLSWLWEPAVRWLIFQAGVRVNGLAVRKDAGA